MTSAASGHGPHVVATSRLGYVVEIGRARVTISLRDGLEVGGLLRFSDDHVVQLRPPIEFLECMVLAGNGVWWVG